MSVRTSVLLVIATGAAMALSPVAPANRPLPAAGEKAILMPQPPTDIPPTVMWGPYDVPDLRGRDYGFYGMAYHGWDDRLNAVYFWDKNVKRYRSLDSTLPARPETIPMMSLPISVPASDSFQDVAYCRYDNSLLLHSSKFKKVYKIDAATGTMRWEFDSPARQYPTGIAWDERGKRIYLADRMLNELYSDACTLYVTDTLGNLLGKRALTHLSTLGRWGARCMDFDYSNSNPNWPSLLLNYTYFDLSGTYLDSVVLFELDRTTLDVIHRVKLPSFTGYVENVRGVAWDPRNSDYWVGIMQRNIGYEDNAVYKMDGWYQPNSPDVGIMTLVQPRGACSVGVTIQPRAIVRNFGLASATFPVRFRIPQAGYDETRSKTLAPGDEDTVCFPVWTPPTVGSNFTARCSTMLAGDVFARNDTWTEPFDVIGRDVGCTRVLAPVGVLDSGLVVTPACSVYNYGSLTENYPVRMTIGSFYDRSANVMGHLPGERRYVEFPAASCTLSVRGLFTVACSTRLAGDTRQSNNKAEASLAVGVVDAELLSIDAPGTAIDSGPPIAPSATVRNNGTAAATFDVRFTIDDGTDYSSTRPVTDLAPGATEQVVFGDWTPRRGTFAMSCTTLLGGDMVEANNRQTGSVTVAVLDAQALSIDAPTGSVPLGTAVEPKATVRNNSTSSRSFAVRFEIADGSAYSALATSSELAPGESEQLVFDEWTATIPGNDFPTRCTTMLAGDLAPGNDLATGSVSVRSAEQDVGAVAVSCPHGVHLIDDDVIPAASWHNYGTAAASFRAWMMLGDPGGSRVYEEPLDVAGLAPGADTSVEFPHFVLNPAGAWTARCSTWLAGDATPGNDTIDREFEVAASGTRDIAVDAIEAPTGTVMVNEIVRPRARLRNAGTVNVAGRAWFVLSFPADGEMYRQCRDVPCLVPGEEMSVDFPAYDVGGNEGSWATRCSAYAPGDAEPGNDERSGRFTVAWRPDWPYGWREVKEMPALPSTRAVKDGGWLAMGPARRLYAAKGYKQGDFYEYNPLAGTNGTWQTLETIPAYENGRIKPPKKGCVGVSDGERYVFMVKGNNTFGFWRYDIPADTWERLPDVPAGPEGKAIKGGNDLAYVAAGGDTGWVYLLKGFRTEFYRFNTLTLRWDTLDRVPFGTKPKYYKGSFLVSDDAGHLYAHQAKYVANGYHFMYGFDLAGQCWRDTLKGMPLIGLYGGRMKNKKAKDGSSGAWYDGSIYALKGGNTQQFFRYFAASDSWVEMETIPQYGSTAKRKRVKDGGDLAGFGFGYFFALKGNKTRECWRYGLAPSPGNAGSGPVSRTGAAGSGTVVLERALRVSPVPVTGGMARLECPGFDRCGLVTVAVFDALGRCVQRRTEMPADRFALDTRTLRPGIYLVRLAAGNRVKTGKLVVE